MAIINSAGFIRGEATDEWSSLYFDFLYFTNMKREKIQTWILRTHLHPALSYIVYSWIVFPKQTIQWYESTTNLSISRNKIANNNVLSTNAQNQLHFFTSKFKDLKQGQNEDNQSIENRHFANMFPTEKHNNINKPYLQKISELRFCHTVLLIDNPIMPYTTLVCSRLNDPFKWTVVYQRSVQNSINWKLIGSHTFCFHCNQSKLPTTRRSN